MEKKNELVEYSKEIATSINEFSAYELDIFLCLVFVSKTLTNYKHIPENENLKLELPATAIKKFLSGKHNSRIKKALANIFDTKVYLKDDKYTKVRHIFEGLDFSSDYKTISFELKKDYIKFFYNLTGNFTQHKIREFTSLKSRYAKRIYQLIMSYKGLHKWEFEANEFRKILDIPNSYGWADIEIKLIKKVNIELKKNTNIDKILIEKIKIGRSIGNVVLKWYFKNPEILHEVEFINEPRIVSYKNNQCNKKKKREKLSKDSEELINLFNNFDNHLKEIIIKKAETYFLNELGRKKKDKITQKIWESTKNIYIAKALRGEI